MRPEAKAVVVDTRPGAEDSHAVEVRRGFTTVSRCSVQKTKDTWYLHSLATPEQHRGRGYARQLVRAVEASYSPVHVRADNPGFWRAMGYRITEAGMGVRDFGDFGDCGDVREDSGAVGSHDI